MIPHPSRYAPPGCSSDRAKLSSLRASARTTPCAGQDQWPLRPRLSSSGDPTVEEDSMSMTRTMGHRGSVPPRPSSLMMSSGSSSITGPGLSRGAMSNAFRTRSGTVDRGPDADRLLGDRPVHGYQVDVPASAAGPRGSTRPGRTGPPWGSMLRYASATPLAMLAAPGPSVDRQAPGRLVSRPTSRPCTPPSSRGLVRTNSMRGADAAHPWCPCSPRPGMPKTRFTPFVLEAFDQKLWTPFMIITRMSSPGPGRSSPRPFDGRSFTRSFGGV